MNGDKSFKEPEDIEVPRDEGQKEEVVEGATPEPEAKETEETEERDDTEFTASVTLKSDLIESKSLQECITILDYQLQAIRNLAIKKITELKS